MSLERARAADLDEIRTLLRSSGLPSEDVDAAGPQAHWVWRSGSRVVGTVGLDVVASGAVLRSLATHPDFRGQGIATALCDAAEAEAVRRGATSVFLLTESAAGFVERRGYRAIERSTVPAPVAAHRQFATAVCQSAMAMAKSLDRT